MCEHDTPVSVCPDGFCGFRIVTSIGETDVEVTDRLARAIVGAEGIVSGVYLVKVNETSEQDISPHVVWEYRVSWVVDDLCFACLDIKVVVLLKFESGFQLGVGWCMGGHEVPPCKE